MNVTPVKNTNPPFGRKAEFGLKFARDLSNAEYPMEAKLKGNLEKMKRKIAEELPLKSDITVAQRGKDLLINSGELTSYVKNAKAMDAEALYEAIEANVNINNRTCKELKPRLENLKEFYLTV